MHGFAHCRDHMDDLDRQRKHDTGERLIALTALALDTLEEVLRNGRRNEDRVRAAQLVIARTLPVTGPAPVQINLLGGPADDGDQYSESAAIRKRLAELRESHERMALAQGKSIVEQLRDLRADDVIDAEIITEEPEPAAAQDIPAPGAEPWPQREAAG